MYTCKFEKCIIYGNPQDKFVSHCDHPEMIELSQRQQQLIVDLTNAARDRFAAGFKDIELNKHFEPAARMSVVVILFVIICLQLICHLFSNHN